MMKKHLVPLTFLGAILTGVAVDFLFFFKIEDLNSYFGINVFLFQMILFGIYAILQYVSERPFTKNLYIPAGFATFFALVFGIWTAIPSLILATIGLFVSNLLLILSLRGAHHKYNHVTSFIIDVIEEWILSVTGYDIFGKFERTKIGSNAKGIIYSIPFVVIFSALFISSDEILRQKVANFIEYISEFLEPQHIFIAGFFTLVALPLYSRFFVHEKKTFNLPAPIPPRNIRELSIITSILSGLFLAFISFQSFYLFGGQSAWNSISDITYANYAKDGFIQLAIAASLVVFIITTFRYLHGKNAPKKLHIVETILLGETGLILLSAGMRLNLYISAYGYTSMRLFGYWFIASTFLTLVILAKHLLTQKNLWHFYKTTSLTIGVLMMIFIISTPDALAIRLNMHQYVSNEMIESPISCGYDYTNEKRDPYCSSSITPEGYQLLKTLFLTQDVSLNERILTEEEREKFFKGLIKKNCNENHWQTWNLSTPNCDYNFGKLYPESSSSTP